MASAPCPLRAPLDDAALKISTQTLKSQNQKFDFLLFQFLRVRVNTFLVKIAQKTLGSRFFIKENQHYKSLTNIEIDLDYVEDLWIEIRTTSASVVVGTVYRHSMNTIGTFEGFFEKLLDIFNDLNSNNCIFCALGDYNTDLMKVQTNNNVRMHVNNMMSLLYKCAIDLPT